MDALRRILANISEQVKKLSASHKLAMASTALLLLTLLFVVAQWSGKPDMVEVLPGATAAEQTAAQTTLSSVGFKVLPQNGRMMIAAVDAPRARAVLAEAGRMPSDKTLLFRNLIESSKWTNSQQENERNYLNALMNELAETIGQFKGVKSAKVLIDSPKPMGLGAAVKKPTASATVWTQTGEAMPQTMVDAVAGFIAGSVAGLDAERVRIIDGSTGRQRRARGGDDELSTTYLEHAARVEAQTRDKVLDLLSYIPGVIVAVTAQVDVTRVTSSTKSYLPEGEGSLAIEKRSTETITKSVESVPGGEPGPMSNQLADINRGSGAAGGTESSETTSESEAFAGTKQETVLDPRGHPTMVAVSVNVPTSFIEGLVKPREGEQVPDAAAVAKKFEEVQAIIRAGIRPQVKAMTAQTNQKLDLKSIDAMVDDSISVSIIPDMAMLGGAATQPTGMLATFMGGGGGGGGVGVLGLSGGLIEKGVLGLLAMVAMGMMVVMVKKAGKKTDIPSAEELVGLPPSLELQADVIGEADEGELAMEGIEVGDDQMQSQKLLETVSQMVQSNPESAAKMLNRWIDVEE
jgi:flagellar biosynthesis/type III secretory pathway M-ring protein FliF/YscJ